MFCLGSDRKTARRITMLVAEIQREPFTGIGKPEPLKGELSGYLVPGGLTTNIDLCIEPTTPEAADTPPRQRLEEMFTEPTSIPHTRAAS